MHVEALQIILVDLQSFAFDICWEVMTSLNIRKDGIVEEFYSTRRHCLFKKFMR